MTPELEQLLYTKFPKLYAQRNLSMMETLMCWGIEPGTGWFLLIYNLSEALEAINNKAGAEFTVEATQVKEKYGGLRFYVNGYTPEVSKLIKFAEHQSYRTCEICGSPGRLNDGSWKMVRCGRHARGY